MLRGSIAMSIRCQLCDAEFPKIIPYQHLQKEHGITGREYSRQYGSTISEETRQLQQKRVPHNRGKKITDPELLAAHRDRIKKREARYQAGEFLRGKPHSTDTRQKISESVRKYSESNREELSTRAHKAVVTKRSRGYITSGMAGRTHSEETKKKILISTQQHREEIRIQTIENRKQLLESYDIAVIDIDRDTIICECNVCRFHFTRTFTNSNKQKLSQILHNICPKCREKSPLHSRAELEICDWVRNHTTSAVRLGDRSVITPLELDIYIPEKKLAIEYCGLYWHSENTGQKTSAYHQIKWQRCLDQGIKLITIFEDEWIFKKDIVQQMLIRNLGITTNRLAARKCKIIDLDTAQARNFFEKNHIHGYAASKIRLGLLHDDQLVYAMTFSQKNISRKNTEWEIQRMAGSADLIVQGGAGKLFAEFCRRVQPCTVVSYADSKWFTGDSYSNLGFVLEKHTSPGYWYFSLPDVTRIHRFTLRKNAQDNPDLTEWQNRQSQGWDRIWDCGHARWVWNKANSK